VGKKQSCPKEEAETARAGHVTALSPEIQAATPWEQRGVYCIWIAGFSHTKKITKFFKI
jgi:hypothetical protein